jgi:hypothetical protein
MKNSIKLVLLGALLVVFVQSCTGSKEIVLNESPDVEVVAPTWTEIMPGQEDGQKTIVVFLPVTSENEKYAIDSIFFQGYHQELTYKTKTSAGAGYQAVIAVGKDNNSVEPPYELTGSQALVSYFDAKNVRHYFRVNDIKQADSIFMP